MQVVTAIFPNRSSAVVARDLLGDEHYAFRWLAVTQPADDADDDGGAHEAHQLAEASDGALGAIGRFLSGAGPSLQLALMDHDVSREDAQTIDASIGTSGAVLVIHSEGERAAEAAKILEHAGGRIVSDRASVADDPALSPAGGTSAPRIHVSTEDEHVFVERRVRAAPRDIR